MVNRRKMATIYSHKCNRISGTLAISFFKFVTHTGLSWPAWALLAMPQEKSVVCVISQLREKLWPLAIVIKCQNLLILITQARTFLAGLELSWKFWPSVDFLATFYNLRPGLSWPGLPGTFLEILGISRFSGFYL